MSTGPARDQSAHFQQQADYWREDYWAMYARKEVYEQAMAVLSKKDLPPDAMAVIKAAADEASRLGNAHADVVIKRGKQAKGNEPMKGGAGSVVLGKAVGPDGQIRCAFQLLNTDGLPLAFLEMSRRETENLVRQLRGAIVSIWGI